VKQQSNRRTFRAFVSARTFGIVLTVGMVGSIALSACASQNRASQNRASQESVCTGLAGNTLPPRSYQVCRPVQGEPLRIDGVLDERSWQILERKAAVMNFVRPANGAPPLQATRAMMLWDDSTLYVAVQVDDGNILATLTERDAFLWKEDVVELFVAGERLDEGYTEIEFSPRNTVLDLFVVKAVDTSPVALPYSVVTLGVRSAVQVQGVLNDSTTADKGWTLECAVPLKELVRQSRSLPQNGDKWRINLLRIDYGSTAANTALQGARELSAWSPTGVPKFHVPEMFGEIVFSGDVLK